MNDASALPCMGSDHIHISYLIFINDLPSTIHNKPILYADNDSLSCIRKYRGLWPLQADLYRISRWTIDKYFPQNQQRCKLLNLVRKEFHAYCLHGCDPINGKWERPRCCSYQLAVASANYARTAKRTNTNLGQFRCMLTTIEMDCFSKVYNSYVRLHLENRMQFWCLYLRPLLGPAAA